MRYKLLNFHPDATLDEINKNIWFIKDLHECPFDFGRAEVVAGSPLEAQVIHKGLLQGNWPNWDYRIKDPAVEQMFRIFLATFRRSDCGFSGLVHSLIALAYRANIVRRIILGKVADQMHRETENLVRKTNAFVLNHIIRMYALTANLKSGKDLDQLGNSIRAGCRDLSCEAENLSQRMNRLQIVEKKFLYAGVPGVVQDSPMLQSIFRI